MQWSLLKIVLVCAANNRAPTLPSTICMQQSSACEKQWQTFAEGAVKPLPGILRSRRYYSNEPWPYVRRRPRSEWLCVSHDSWLRQAKKKKNDCQVLFHNLLLGRYYRYPKCMCTSTETVHFFIICPNWIHPDWTCVICLTQLVPLDRWKISHCSFNESGTAGTNVHSLPPAKISQVIKTLKLQ